MEELDRINELIRSSIFLDSDGNIIENPFNNNVPPVATTDTVSISMEEVVPTFTDSDVSDSSSESLLEDLREFIDYIESNSPTTEVNSPTIEAEVKTVALPEIEDILKAIIDVFIKHYSEEYVDVKLFSDSVIITVKHPEITITNSLEISHLIKDFYIRFTFLVKKEDYPKAKIEIVQEYIRGIRGAFSMKEWLSGYGFSHLSSSIENWGGFCFGSDTPISIQYKESLLKYCTSDPSFTDTSNPRWVDSSVFIDTISSNISIFLHVFDTYLTWESIEGGPYKLLSSLGTNRFSSKRLSSHTCIDTESFRYAKIIVEKILGDKELIDELIISCLVNSGDGIKIDIYQLTMLIDSLFNDDEKYKYTENAFIFHEYIPLTMEILEIAKDTAKRNLDPEGIILNGASIEFKGVFYNQCVYDYNKEEYSKKYDMIISPVIVASVAIEILKILKNLKLFINEYRK